MGGAVTLALQCMHKVLQGRRGSCLPVMVCKCTGNLSVKLQTTAPPKGDITLAASTPGKPLHKRPCSSDLQQAVNSRWSRPLPGATRRSLQHGAASKLWRLHSRSCKASKHCPAR